jgi:hypothetical protein
MPGINCWGVPGACNQSGPVSTDRLRIPLPNPPWELVYSGGTVLPGDYEELESYIRERLQLPDTVPLPPGIRIGPVRLECKGRQMPPLHWPGLDVPVITEELRSLFQSEGFTGWHSEEVVIERGPKGACPTLYELVVQVSDALVSEPPRRTPDTCSVCGRPLSRPQVPARVSLAPDAAESLPDLVQFGPPLATMLFVKERVKRKLEETYPGLMVFVPFEAAAQDILDRSRRYFGSR